MKIVNLMPHSLVLYDPSDTRPAGPKGYVLSDKAAKPVCIIPSSGISRAACTETPVGNVTGIPVFRMTFGDPEGVPEPQQGVMYVVSSITARACAEIGRTTSDLIMPARTVRDDEGRIIGCTAFSVL